MGFDYSYIPEAAEMGGMAGIMLIYLFAVLIGGLVGITLYVFQSVGLYSIAKRRGIHHAWLAWIPLGVYWIIGSISDQYQYVARGQIKSRRKLMLTLSIVLLIAEIALLVLAAYLFSILVGLDIGGVPTDMAMVAPAIGAVIAYLVMLVVAIVLTVFLYICLYNLYFSCNPNNATVYLVLGVLFNFLLPIFIFASRNQDLGMPPRRRPIQEPVWQPDIAEEV